MSFIPRVSVGLAVYNGENFVREAIDSILNQTFTDFELIITDNASTDRTQAICQEYVVKDQRIRYYRNERNIGGIRNQNLVLSLSRGEYFKLAAHDDICAPEFLEECVEILDRDPSVVLSYSRAQIINERGEFFDSDEPYVKYTNAGLQLATSLRPQARFREIACLPHSCQHIFGVIRMSALQSIPWWGTYAGSDRSLLARLALLGRFEEVPECLFFLRRHSGQSINIGQRSLYLYNIWYCTDNKGRIVLPGWLMFYEYFMAMRKAPMSWHDRIGCYLRLFGPYLKTDGLRMIKDLIVGTLQLLDRLYGSLPLPQNVHPQSLEEDLIFGRFPRARRPYKTGLNE